MAPDDAERQSRRQRFDSMLAAYDQFAANIEANLCELRAIDQTRFDAHFSHLAKANFPRSVADPTLGAGFTTVEAAFLRQGNTPSARTEGGYHVTEEEFRRRNREAMQVPDMQYVPSHAMRAYLDSQKKRDKNDPQPWKETR